MKTVVTLGEILVEIMATRTGQSFRAPGTLTGPYPSGAPAIFIDQVAKLGQPSAMIASVGDDDFGHLNVERLRADGVDVSAIAIHPDVPTGTAFVTYREDGTRHFVFNIRHSASGHVRLDAAADAVLARADHFHVMGTSLMSPEVIAVMGAAIDRVRQKGGTISFDPNSRSELRQGSELAAFTDHVVAVSDIVMPSGPEILSLTGATDEASAVAKVLDRGAGCVVMKRGAAGSAYFDRERRIESPPFRVEEVDPTGAGDVFGATFIVCRLRGMPVADCLRYANASGARKVQFKGPMEGVSSFDDLDRWMAERSTA